MRVRYVRRASGLFALILTLLASGPSTARVVSVFAFDDSGNWSIDGGHLLTDIDVLVPDGSEVVQAYLYCSTSVTEPAPPGVGPTIVLDGTTYRPSDFSQLDFVPFPTRPPQGMQAYRADVTAQVVAKVGTGRALPFPFSIDSESISEGGIDGELLVVVYRNPAEARRHIELFDGGMVTLGDTVYVALPGPIDPSIPGFEALLSVGIGFSYASDQVTEIDVDGRRLSSEAGDHDDGILSHLITVGGLDDDPANPSDPTVPDHPDDELYDLARGNGLDPTPFLAASATSFRIVTINPSGDDNLFFVGVNVLMEAGPGNCSASAAASTIEVCGSGVATLDAPGSVVTGCSVLPEYRFRAAAVVLRDWNPAPTFDWVSPATGPYEVDVRCPTDLTCSDTAIGFVDVIPDLAPSGLGNSLRAIRLSADIELIWAPHALASSYSLYRETDKRVRGLPHLEDIPGATQVLTGDVPSPPSRYYYRVAGASCSGIEGP